MRVVLHSIVWVAFLLVFAACNDRDTPQVSSSGPAIEEVVRTTFYPTTYVAERISGGIITVVCPIPDGTDPIYWRPDAETIGLYQRARLTLLNGCELEKWTRAAPLARSRVVETISPDDIDGGPIMIEGETHSHGPEGEHTHEQMDGHTWVDPVLAKIQAASTLEAMIAAFPEHSETFRANATDLFADLDTLNERLKALTPALQAVTLLASHPAYNYPSRRLNWGIVNFHFEPDASLDESQLAEIEAVLRDRPSSRPIVMIWESEPTQEIQILLAERFGITSIVFSPAEQAPTTGDYLSIMNDNIDRLAEAISALGESGE